MNKLALLIFTAVFTFSTLLHPSASNAFLFHATKKAVARKIAKRGFSKAKMKFSDEQFRATAQRISSAIQ